MKRSLIRIFIAGLMIVVAIATVIPSGAQVPGRGAVGRGESARPPAKAAPSQKAKTVAADRVEHVSEELEKTLARMSEQLQQPLPKRAYKVETGPAKKTKLFKADPKLLENKFLVTIVVDINKSDTDEGLSGPRGGFGSSLKQTDWQMASGSSSSSGPRSRSDAYPEELAKLVRWGSTFLFSPSMGHSHVRHIPLSQRHREILEQCSAEDRPKGPAVDFLLSADCDRDVRVSPVQGDSGRRTEGWEYNIYATSVEEGEQRATAVLELLDAGICRPMQRYLLPEGRKMFDEARRQYVEVAQAGAVLRAEEAKLEKPSEISPDILSQLKAQKVMVVVELAGLNARVKACDEMLKDPAKLQVSALQSISDMKVKAEIERFGIREKLDQINAFIGEGDDRQSIRDRIDELTKNYNGEFNAARFYESRASTMARLFDLYQPLPLKDDQITINPVEWTN